MRKKRTPENEEQRNERIEKQTQRRIDNAAMADKAIDAMVRQTSSYMVPDPPHLAMSFSGRKRT